MLIEFDELDEAERVLAEASEIMAQESTAPRRWLPKILIQRARVAELRGNQAAAGRLLTGAIEAQQALFSKSRTEGLAYLALGRVYTSQGRGNGCAGRFSHRLCSHRRAGGAVCCSKTPCPSSRAGLAEAKRNPAERDALHAEMFEVGQMIRGPLTAQWMARTAARLAAGDQEVSVLIRELEAARRKRDQLPRATHDRASPISACWRLKSRHWKANGQTTNARIASLGRQVQAAAPPLQSAHRYTGVSTRHLRRFATRRGPCANPARNRNVDRLLHRPYRHRGL